jgi:hypothetical protein
MRVQYSDILNDVHIVYCIRLEGPLTMVLVIHHENFASRQSFLKVSFTVTFSKSYYS